MLRTKILAKIGFTSLETRPHMKSYRVFKELKNYFYL